jgi:hypothetical protein
LIIATLLVGVTVGPSLGGCTSMRVVPPAALGAAPSLSRIKHGDTVTVLTRDGQVSTFRVLTVERDALVAVDHMRYPRDAIVRLERREINKVRTIALMAGAAGTAVVVTLAWAVASVLGGWT